MQLKMKAFTSGARNTTTLPRKALLLAKIGARASPRRVGLRAAHLVVLAAGNDGKGDPKTAAKKEELVQGLKKGGVDQETAARILKVWEETGAKSPDQLRKLLLGKSLRAAGLVSFQTLLDAGASYGGFASGAGLSAAQPFFGKIAVEYLCYFLGLYFATSVFLDLFTLGAIAISGAQYSTNSEAFLAAIREIAGPKQSGINVIQKAQQAVNTAKVFSALNRISGILRERGGDVLTSDDSLRNLSVFLLLQKAEEAGFRAEDYNLSSKQAATIAAVFSKYDLNDDMVLSVSEVARLFQQEGYNFSEAEVNLHFQTCYKSLLVHSSLDNAPFDIQRRTFKVKQAIKLLDKNNDNLIQFSEFVDWWQNEVPVEAKQRLEQEAAKSEASKPE